MIQSKLAQSTKKGANKSTAKEPGSAHSLNKGLNMDLSPELMQDVKLNSRDRDPIGECTTLRKKLGPTVEKLTETEVKK